MQPGYHFHSPNFTQFVMYLLLSSCWVARYFVNYRGLSSAVAATIESSGG